MRNIIRFDWAIKRILRNKANFDILEGLLSEILGENIIISGILESEGNKETAENKSNRVDLLAQNSIGELIIVEVQSNRQHDYLARMIFGASKLMVDHMIEGMPYSNVKKIISVNIVFFDLGHGIDYVYRGTTKFEGIHKHDVLELSDREKEVFNCNTVDAIGPVYYIIKVNQFDNIAKDTLDEWIKFLKGDGVSENTRAKGLKAANRKLGIMELSEDERLEYERYIDFERNKESEIMTGFREGKAEGKEEGIAIGKEEGIAIGEANKVMYAEQKTREKAIEMAKKCLSKGMSIPVISDLTGLSEVEIRNML